MKRKIKDIAFGTEVGDIAVGHALGETLREMVLSLSPENIQEAEVDIVLTVDGKEVDVMTFFKHLSDSYFNYVGKAAKRLIADEITEKLTDLQNVVVDATNKIECLSNNIDWDIKVLKTNYEADTTKHN